MDKKLGIFRSAFIPFCLVISLWCVKGIEWASGSDFTNHGIFPLRMEGLPGIITSPFIHANFHHLFDNSIPLFLLTWAVFYFYNMVAVRVLIYSWLLGGFWVWLGARTGAYHIGASGLVYSFAGFLFLSGILSNYPRLIAISLLVIFLYGGLVWGLFPYDNSVSWESHLYGLIAGLVLAILFRGNTPRRETVVEIMDDETDTFPYWDIDDPEKEHVS